MTHPDPVFRVLFVCTGNTCRSPMASAALRLALGVDGERVAIESAGTATSGGQPAAAHAVEVAGKAGGDLRAHRSQRLTSKLVQRSDLVLAMESAHRDSARALGAPADRVHVLSDWPPPGEPSLPLEDPVGASREAYEECWRRITRHLERVVPHIRDVCRARSA